MNQSDFANHIGVNRSHVTQLKNAGRLVMQDGKVSVDASIKLIADTKDPGKVGVAARHEKDREQKQTASAPAAAPVMDDITGKAGSAYQQARAMKEKYAAMSAKISYEKEVGTLLLADDARFAVADGDTIIRNRLESLPDILAPQLAAETDEQKIRSLLMDHIESLLGDLSRSFYNLAK
jgi:hypothetical protein